jgi:hypothetical protein
VIGRIKEKIKRYAHYSGINTEDCLLHLIFGKEETQELMKIEQEKCEQMNENSE